MPRLIVPTPPAPTRSIVLSKPKIQLKLAYAPYADLDSIQQRAICKFAKLSELKAIAWWRVGLGKTRLALGLYALLAEQNDSLPCVALMVARPAFEYDLRAELRNIGFDCVVSTERNAWRISTRKPTIFFASFASLQKVQQPISEVESFLNLVIVDELYLFSNPKSNRSRRLAELTRGNAAIGLGGSILPAGDNFAVWGQSCALGMESKLARGATRFRSEFQTSTTVDFKNGRAPCMLFKNKVGWKDRVFQRLGPHIDVQFPEKLSRTIEKITTVPTTKEQQPLIQSLVDNFFMEIEDREFDLSYTFQTTTKIRGILNGWVELEPGHLHMVASEKVSTIIDQLRELHSCKEQCVVWCAFRNDIKHLASMLDFASLQMVGGRPFDTAAWHRKDAYIVLATLGSGSSVNHFSQTPYAKFFSLTYKSLDLIQAKGRTDRRDTRGDTFYEFIQCAHSLDGEIFRHVQKVGGTETDFIRSAQLWLRTQQHSHSARK